MEEIYCNTGYDQWSLRLVVPGIAVPPGVTHFDSHHL